MRAPIITDPGEAMRALDDDEWVGLDIETSGLSPWRDAVATIQLYGDRSRATALLHVRGYLPPALRAWLGDPRRSFIAHNGTNFDVPFLSTHGVDIAGPMWFDSLVAEGTTLSFGRKNLSISLKATLARHFDVELDKDINHGGWMNPTLTDQQVAYAVDDVRYLPRLRLKQLKVAAANEQLEALDVELAAAPAVTAMIVNGLPIDLWALRTYLEGQADLAERLKREVAAELGPINVASSKQVGTALEAHGRRVPRTPKGNYQTDSVTLKDMADDGDDLCALVVSYREAKQRLNMYSPEWVAKYVYNGRVHAKFKQVGTDTGRFSSSEPNLQQVPKDMRGVFGGLDGYVVVSRDYSQLEIRVAAALAADSALLGVLESEDVHATLAAQTFGIAPAEVTPEQRSLCKALSFTLLFGGGADTFRNYASRNGSHLDKVQAYNICEQFFKDYPGIDTMKEQARRVARRGGSATVQLPGGLRRQLAGPSLTLTRLLNTAVQGTAAAGLKRAMVAAREAGLDQYFGATVHDELVAAVPEDEAVDYDAALGRAMELGMREVVDAPIRSEGKIGRYWK